MNSTSANPRNSPCSATPGNTRRTANAAGSATTATSKSTITFPFAVQATSDAVREEILAFKKQVYYVGAGKAALLLIAISATFLIASVFVVRIREYATDRAAGA